ncbi:MAG TPA: NADH-ubiquinone oxidoreductase-F iron-sulfur binding region domain-containing protein [Gaiellaceae bacterium]|nr:NADH-ubiquinone oxidoreductase-F iron-sulfur binding region domain-containing protein [Gaiellaceae bacterium]
MSAETLSSTWSTPRRAGPAGLPRVLATVREDGRPELLRGHMRRHGTTDDAARGSDLIAEIEASGLTGRGGGSFPTARKLRAVVGGKRRPVVVVNGAESEPASGKDRALLRTLPHLVLDGAVLAADAVGAHEVTVGVGRRSLRERDSVAAALAERAPERIDGRVKIRLVEVPSGFVSGEETALVHFLDGGPAKPTSVPPRPFERGVGGAPTLVQNVETLAHLALIARYGSGWFRELGTTREPGSVLVTISGAVRRRGVHEFELGTPLSNVVAEAGGVTGPVSGLLVGGYFGSWLAASAIEELRLLDADLPLGARAIVVLPDDTCALGEAARVARYLAGQSAGQCGPCVHGLDAIAGAMEQLVTGSADAAPRIRRWADMVAGRGACRHPDGATQFVASALDVFADEVAQHARYGRCRSTVRGVLPLPRPGAGT